MKNLWRVSILIYIFLILISNKAYSEGNYYTVQIGAYAEGKYLNNYITKLETLDIEYRIEKGTLTKFYYGKFDTKIEANKGLDYIKSKGLNGYVLLLKDNEIKEVEIKEKVEDTTKIENTTESAIIEGVEEIVAVEIKETEEKLKIKNIVFKDDIVFQGVFGENNIFFTVNKYWNIDKDSYISLRYNYNITEEYYGSSITAYINGVPIYTEKLDKIAAENYEIKIPISSEYLIEGTNELKIKSYNRLTDAPCLDSENPASWIVILKNSYIHLAYNEIQDGETLKEYPYPYFQEGSDNIMQSEIILSENYTEKDLKGVLLLNADMGMRAKFEDIDSSINIYNKEKNYADKHLIYIGDYITLPDKIKLAIDKKYEKGGWITEIESPWNKNKRMLLILGNEAEIIKSCQILSRAETLNQLDKNELAIDENIYLTQKIENKDFYKTFVELGYGNILLEGSRNASFKIGYNMPKEWELDENAQIHLKMRYSDVIDYDKSSVSIFINNIPIFSKKLTKEGTVEDDFFVDIPREFRNQSFLSVDVKFTLEVPMDCESSGYDKNLWAYIDNNSYLYLSHTTKEIFDLRQYPYPLVEENKFSDFTLLINRDMDLNSLGSIFGYLGHSLTEISDFNIVFDTEEIELKGDILYIGVPSRGVNGANMNKVLKIGYAEDLNAYTSEYQDLIGLNNPDISVLQIAHAENMHLLAVTSLDTKSLKDSLNYLSKFEYVNSLDGIGMAVYTNGNNQVLLRDKEADIVNTIDTKKEINRTALDRISGDEIRRFLIYLLGISITIVVVIILKKK